MSLVEVCILYKDEIQKNYFENLIYKLNLENHIYLVFENYHNNSEYAYNKLKLINENIHLKTTNNFIILLDENDKIFDFRNIDLNNKIHIIRNSPCFDGFLISHFVDNFLELQKKCNSKSIFENGQLDRLERMGKLKNICDHCIEYIRCNNLIENYERGCVIDFSKIVDKEKIKVSFKQTNTLKEIINFFKTLNSKIS